MDSNGVPLSMCSGRKRKHKREDNVNCDEEGAGMKENQAEKDLDQLDQNVESMDRISHLPDEVIHHILSLLRNVKDTIRTSILSERWRALWYSFSVSFSILIFDERKFTAGIGQEDSGQCLKGKKFRDYVSNSLHTHLEKNLYIQKLVVHMTSFDLEDAPHVDHWLSVAIENNIKELDLHVGIKELDLHVDIKKKKSRRYTLPQSVFSSITLTELRLSGCMLRAYNNIMLPNLQKLYLWNLHLVEHIIQNLISSCHSIEDLRFIRCSGLELLHVLNLIKLNRVEIHHCNQLKRVEISAPNLHTFWYCSNESTPCKVSLKDCISLKRLTLEHLQVTRDFCENQTSEFPGCKKLGVALVKAPNLLSFEYKGETMPYIEFLPSCLTEAKFSFEPKSERKDVRCGDESWSMMRDFISRFDPEGFKLVFHSSENIVIHENLNTVRIPPVPDLCFLCFQIIKSSACIDDILNSLLRTWHPVSISIVSPVDSDLPKAVYEMIKSKDEDPICCRHHTSNYKCWRHFLKDMKFENSKDIKFADMSAWLMASSTTLQCQMINLRLFWNSSST